MTVEHTGVTITGNRAHVKMSNNLRAACRLQQELGVLFFVASLPFLFPPNSHSCNFIPVYLEL